MDEQANIPKRRPAGRPRAGANKRSKMIGVAVSQAEYEAINQQAAALGLTASEYARKLIFKGRVVSALTPEEFEAIRDIAGFGNNLNQITRRAYMGGIWSVKTELENLLTNIRNILEKYNSRKSYDS